MTAPQSVAPTPERPWVSCNLAISADGKISSAAKRPCGWTSERDHQRLRDLRCHADALLAGRATVEIDRMTMTAAAPNNQPPLRCVVSRSGILPPNHPLFHRPGGAIHWLFTENPTDEPNLPAQVIRHHSSLAAFLHTLSRDHGVRHLHCEGGGEIIRALALLDVIDSIHLTLAGHTIFGGNSAPTLTGTSDAFLPASQKFSLNHFDPDPETGECYLDYLHERHIQHTVPGSTSVKTGHLGFAGITFDPKIR